MMVADDLRAPSNLCRAMTVMKMEAFAFPRLQQCHAASELAVMVACDRNHFATTPNSRKQLVQGVSRRPIVHEVADDDQSLRPIFIQQSAEPLLDRLHSPEWNEPASRALTKLVPKVQICDREPPLLLVKQGEPRIQDYVWPDNSLSRE